MTGTIKKRLLSLLLALAVLVSTLAAFGSASTKAQAASVSEPQSVQEVEERLNKIINGEYGNGKYFPYNKNSDPAVPDSLAGIGAGRQCFGYARYVFYQTFGLVAPTLIDYNNWQLSSYENNMDKIADCNDKATVNGIYNDIHKAKRGDWIQADYQSYKTKEYIPHSMIILTYDDNSVTVLDCNSDGLCNIKVRTMTYSQFVGDGSTDWRYHRYTIYSAKNYPDSEPEVPPTPPEPPETQAEVESRLADIRNGRYGENTTFPYSSIPVPASLAGEKGGTRTLGYARYVFYQVFGISMPHEVEANEYQLKNSSENLVTIASCGGTSDAATMKADILNTKPGDIIQGKGNGFYQTMIVLSHDENSITILDCDNDYKCTVLVRTRDWAAFSKAFPQYTIYRSKNYPNSGLPTVRISPNGGSFANTQKVTITTEPANSMINIYYTTDGTVPTNKSTKYTGAFTLSESATVKAVAYLSLLKTDVATATFTRNHTHNWSGWTISTKPTLTATGTATRICQSDSSHVDTYTLPNLTNSLWTKGASVAATCAAEGSQTYTSAYGSVTIATPKTEHTWGEWNYFPATPAAGAYRMRKCNACGFEQAEDIEHGDKHNPHKVEGTPASCTETGIADFWVCDDCGMEFSDAECTTPRKNVTVPALGHNWGAWKVTTDATETTEGVETRTCGRCNTAETRTTSVLPHTHKPIKHEELAPTCTTNGHSMYWSCFCGQIFIGENGSIPVNDYIRIAKTGHSWSDWKVTTAPTETAEGIETRTCLNNCGESETRTISVSSHIHTLVKHSAVSATCTSAGNNAYWTCSACNRMFSDENGKVEINKVPTIAATGHKSNNGEITQAPSCTVKGIKTYKCSVCGETLKIEDISATGHNWSEWITETPATETDDGIKARTCQSCGEKQTKSIPAISHTHTLVKHNAVPVACMTNGTDEYWTCSGCEGIFGNEDGTKELNEIPTIAATGHKWNNGKITTPATTENEGIKTYTCTVCGDTKTESIPKLTNTDPDTPNIHTHTYSAVWSSDNKNHWHAATCEHTGEVSDKAAHSWNGGKVTKQPTTSSEGVKTYTCTVCSKTRTEAIAKLSSSGSGGSGGSSNPGRPSRPSTPTPGTVSDDIRYGENVPNVKINMSLDKLTEAIFTSSEQWEIKNGTGGKIILSVNNVDEEFFKSFLGSNEYTIVLVLDIDLLKELGGSETKVTETNSEIAIEIEIPEALRKTGRDYVVIRYHNGKRDILNDLDSSNSMVTIQTNRFSIYALAYRTENTALDTNNTSDTSSENSGSTESTNSGSTSSDNSGSSNSSSDTSDNGTTSGGESSSNNDNRSASSDSGSSNESSSSDNSDNVSNSGTTSSDGTSSDNDNPSTGIAVSILPITAALAAMTFAIKRRRK